MLARIGWSGAVNTGHDGRSLSAVLRSWEDRYGATLVSLGFATMTLAVHRPPCRGAEASVATAEHYGFCPDALDQGVEDARQYADGLANESAWFFWWD